MEVTRKMKTSMIVALVGVIGLVAFAGTVVAAGSLPAGTAANGSGTGGMDGMHGGMHQNGYQNQYNQSSTGCPMGQDYNHTWDNDYGGCGCSG
jgi:hypothetical protein